MVISTLSLQRRWQRLQRPLAVVLLTTAALLLWGRGQAGTPSQPTLVAARDVPAGQVLTGEDLAVAAWPPAVRPAAALSAPDELVGRRTSAALTAGEPLTEHRVIGASAVNAAGVDQAAVLVPEDPLAAAEMIQTGDRVDVVGNDRDGPRTLVTQAAVLGLTGESGVILAVPASAAPAVAEAAATGSVALVLRGR